MPQQYKPKEGVKKRIPVNKDKLKIAVSAVLAGGTLKGTAKKYEAEEKDLAKYLETASKLYHGLTPKNVRMLAYQFAKRNDKKIPDNWVVKEEASYDWFWGFMKRHNELSLRKPEATSLSRATSFNRHNVGTFFGNLKSLMDRFQFPPQQIYNVDETACRGLKQVSKVTSAERGELVTVCSAINAIGNHLPPFMIFPRKNWQTRMLDNAPPGTNGVANPSGWMTVATFLEFMKHFQKHVRSSKENPALIIFDNHESHITVDSVQYAKDHGIHLLTTPPHTSQKLQPLDRIIFACLKSHYDRACDNWMTAHPARPITIYDISGLLGRAYPMAMTPRNVTKSFEVTGIYPLNSDIFTDDEFLSSYVTNRPEQDQPEETLTDAEDMIIDTLQPCTRQSEPALLEAPCDITTEQSPADKNSLVLVNREREKSPSLIEPRTHAKITLECSRVEESPLSVVTREREPETRQKEPESNVPAKSSLANQRSIAIVHRSTTTNFPTLAEQCIRVINNNKILTAKLSKVSSEKISPTVTTSFQVDLLQPSYTNVTTTAFATTTACVGTTHLPSSTISTGTSIVTDPRSDDNLANFNKRSYATTATVTSASAHSNVLVSASPKISQLGEKKLATYLSPEMIRPHPKAGARKTIKKGRKKGATKILTDTPEKEAIEKEHREREEKKRKQLANKIKRNLGKEKTKVTSKSKVKRKEHEETSSDEESLRIPPSPESDAYDVEDELDEKSESEEEDDGNYDNVHEGDWIVVNLTSEKNLVH
ncbi:hypothetical protein ABMA28_003597 [Loxostege sticticalis]|uniref:HTH CENPB-type domain-containing protein n=1 Tax=Loxostege sticticalis TaxID=481309 RepID=A0ABD0T0X1_LOXSC